MSKGNTVASYGAHGREDVIKLDADDIKIAGLDFEAGPDHPLYDPLAEAPPDPGLVANIMEVGIIHPVVVRRVEVAVSGRVTDKVLRIECVVGRGRVKAARAANEILKQRGDRDDVGAPRCILVPARVKGRGMTDADLAAMVTAENAVRRDLSLIERAEGAARLFNVFEMPLSKIAATYGVTEKSISNWLALLKTAAPVKKAVATGELPAAVAIKMAALPKDVQLARLDKMRKSGATKGRAAHRVAKSGNAAKTGTDRLTKRDWWLIGESLGSPPTGVSDAEWLSLIEKIAERAGDYTESDAADHADAAGEQT
jgi:ParB-like chromosome segregation protein Spo0J